MGWHDLTPQEKRITELVCEGLTSEEIGKKLYNSPKTIKSALTTIYEKVMVKNRASLIAKYYKDGRHEKRK